MFVRPACGDLRLHLIQKTSQVLAIRYSFEAAVADIIDNSIDARARSVLVRLIIRLDGRLDLAIWDNGTGMNEKTLREYDVNIEGLESEDGTSGFSLVIPK